MHIHAQFCPFYSNMLIVWMNIDLIKTYLVINHHHNHFWWLPIFVYNEISCLREQIWWHQMMMWYNHEINEYPIDITYGNGMILNICSGDIKCDPFARFLPYNWFILSIEIFQKHWISEFFRGNFMFLIFYTAYARSWLLLLLYLDMPDSVVLI